ncbi:hypothetical protein DITRI_Ditri10aG0021900 [Diplodiscus trichospermus]
MLDIRSLIVVGLHGRTTHNTPNCRADAPGVDDLLKGQVRLGSGSQKVPLCLKYEMGLDQVLKKREEKGREDHASDDNEGHVPPKEAYMTSAVADSDNSDGILVCEASLQSLSLFRYCGGGHLSNLASYLSGTPIGALKDITHAAFWEVTSLVQHRNSSLFYHKFNESQKEQTVLKRLKQGEIVALIIDAGMPGISDPTAKFICVYENIPVVPFPGPSAFFTALSASGLSTDEFKFGNSSVKYRGWPCSCGCLEILTLISHTMLQLDYVQAMLIHRRRGWCLLQVKQQRSYSMFLLRSFVSFKKSSRFLVTPGS